MPHGGNSGPFVSTAPVGTVELRFCGETMSAMKCKLLAVDVDGTLVHLGKLDPRDVRALHRAAAAGIEVCLCTGRSWAEVKPVWQELALPEPHAPVICVGGALVAEPDTGRTLTSRSFGRDVAGELSGEMRRRGYPVMALVDQWREGFDYYELGHFADFPLYRKFFHGRGWQVRPAETLGAPASARTLRISVLEEREQAVLLAADLKRHFAARIEVQDIYAPNYELHIVEAFAAGTNKFRAMVYVGQARKLGPGAMAAIGDDNNDLAMLRGAKFSAAPADAPDNVKQAAKTIVAARGQCAVAEFVEQILKDRQA
jgi:HAD superfamily hydrolase (TIGR01484 family)